MKPVYDSIPILPGTHKPGIVRVQLIPRQFLTTDFSPNFLSGVVEAGITIQSGKSFTELQFIPNSYTFDVKPKETKNGDYNQIAISGILNNVIPNILNVLETARYNEHVVVATDTRRRKRIVGTTQAGMKLTYAEKNSNAANGSQSIQVELALDAETAPPFYIDDTTTVDDLNSIYSNAQSSAGEKYLEPPIDFNPSGDTVIEWTAFRRNVFGDYPVIELWNYENGMYSLGNMPIDSIGNPPTQFIIRNAGGFGKIKISG